MRATAVDKAHIIEVLGDRKSGIGMSEFVKAVELYHTLHGVWPTKLYVTGLDMARAASYIVKGSPWEKMIIICDEPIDGSAAWWFVGCSFDHGVGSEVGG